MFRMLQGPCLGLVAPAPPRLHDVVSRSDLLVPVNHGEFAVLS